MGKLYIRKQPDGSFTLRGVRYDGKALAKNVVRKSVSRRDFKVAAREIAEEIQNPLRASDNS